jgi:hypothetical protein
LHDFCLDLNTMRFSLLIFILLSAFNGFAQKPEGKLVQFSGVIYNADSNSVVPYVTITNTSVRNQAYSANYKGYFSFVAHEGDIMTLSAVGYKSQSVTIPAGLSEPKYTVIINLHPSVIQLPMVRVYPWSSVDDFKKEFLTMKFADDDLEIAKKNVSREALMLMAANLGRDGKEMQSYSFQNNHLSLVNKNMNQRMANPLLNPFAWGALLQQIMQGDKSRSGED